MGGWNNVSTRKQAVRLFELDCDAPCQEKQQS